MVWGGLRVLDISIEVQNGKGVQRYDIAKELRSVKLTFTCECPLGPGACTIAHCTLHSMQTLSFSDCFKEEEDD